MEYPSDFTNKIIYGDCLEVIKHIPDSSIDMILTDPPYGVLPQGKGQDRFNWDNIDIKKFTDNWFNLFWDKLKLDTFFYIFWSQKYLKLGFEIFNPNRLLIWNYENLILKPTGDFAYDYEPIFVIKKGTPKLKVRGKHGCVLRYTKPQSNFKKDRLMHPAQKPLELIKKLIYISSNKNDIILDPFCGSGTTPVGAKELKRRYIGIDSKLEYCQLAERRLSGVTPPLF